MTIRPSDDPDPLLRLTDLSVRFGPVQALDAVRLRVRAGELVALAGENGAGKTTLVRCVAGDVAPDSGLVEMAGRRVPPDPVAAAKQGIAVVWQNLALCDNLDVAANLMLGRETRRLVWSRTRAHLAARELLAQFRIPLTDTSRSVSTLSGGQRQLVAVARAMGARPRLLALDEPTAALGLKETRQVEDLILGLREQGTTMLLACHDVDQMFRLADRIVVLRQGAVVADLPVAQAHPDDVVALLSGQRIDTSPRRQLTRLHGLAGRLTSADLSSSLSLILSALGAALRVGKLAIHLADGQALHCAATLGFDPGEFGPWQRLPYGPQGGPAGIAASDERPVVADDVRRWRMLRDLAGPDGAAGVWAVPVLGPAGPADRDQLPRLDQGPGSRLSGVITVFRAEPGAPQRDEIDLAALYAGYAAAAIDRDRLLDQVTTRNRVLETIREMLQALAGPMPVPRGLVTALGSLRRGLRADEVALVTEAGWRGYAGGNVPELASAPEPASAPDLASAGETGADPRQASAGLRDLAKLALDQAVIDGSVSDLVSRPGFRGRAVAFRSPDPEGTRSIAVLVASWRPAPGAEPDQLAPDHPVRSQETALLEDAAHSLRLALEREEAAAMGEQAAALRRSRELQRGFLSRLSHELRTPLTAIRGYASSLLQQDVTWDHDSQQRFLDRIAAESARLGRLVEDLLDFSAIESGVMRLNRDWCEPRLVIDAAVACLSPEQAGRVTVVAGGPIGPVWADHDRLEQVLVNLLSNAFRHNPAGTSVTVSATQPGPDQLTIQVTDDGAGMPPPGTRSRTAGAGLGLSISRGIVEAHGGGMDQADLAPGTRFRITLPADPPAPASQKDNEEPSGKGGNERGGGR